MDIPFNILTADGRCAPANRGDNPKNFQPGDVVRMWCYKPDEEPGPIYNDLIVEDSQADDRGRIRVMDRCTGKTMLLPKSIVWPVAATRLSPGDTILYNEANSQRAAVVRAVHELDHFGFPNIVEYVPIGSSENDDPLASYETDCLPTPSQTLINRVRDEKDKIDTALRDHGESP